MGEYTAASRVAPISFQISRLLQQLFTSAGITRCCCLLTQFASLSQLFAGIVPNGFTDLLPEQLRDMHLRLHLSLHGARIKDLRNAGFFVASARVLVAGDAADGCLRGARIAVAILAQANATTTRHQLTSRAHAGADADAHRARFVVRLVLYVGGRDRPFGREGVAALLDSRLRAGDATAFEGSVAADVYGEAAIAGTDAALLDDAGVVAVNSAILHFRQINNKLAVDRFRDTQKLTPALQCYFVVSKRKST